MKIAINTKFLCDPNLEGFGRFIYETSKRMVESHPNDQFYFLFDRKYDSQFIFGDNVRPIVIPPQSRHPILWHLWYDVTSKRVIHKLNPDVYLSPDNLSSIGLRVPNVTVIHDIGFERYTHQLPRLVLRYLRYKSPKIAKSSTAIATVSEFSKREIAELYPHTKDKIHVIHNGFTPKFSTISEAHKIRVRQKHSQGLPYILYVGSIHPRKNIERLIQGYNSFRSSSHSPTKLILAGRWAWKTREIENALDQSPYKRDIIRTGYIEQNQLAELMAASVAFAYVSIYEGFGIPILEAMAAGVPVLTSNVSSMPEVAGNAALKVNPFSVEAIASGMIEITENIPLRQKLIKLGNEQYLKFDWTRSSEKLYDLLESVASQ